MICSEGRQWQHFAVNCLSMRGTLGTSYLTRAGKERRESLSVRWVLTSLCCCSICWRDTEGEDGGCEGFYILFLPGDSLSAGTEDCFMFAFTLACYTPRPLLLQECGDRDGSAGANEMYHWPHNPAALKTLLYVFTHSHWPQTHTEPIALVWLYVCHHAAALKKLYFNSKWMLSFLK